MAKKLKFWLGENDTSILLEVRILIKDYEFSNITHNQKHAYL